MLCPGASAPLSEQERAADEEEEEEEEDKVTGRAVGVGPPAVVEVGSRDRPVGQTEKRTHIYINHLDSGLRY